MLLSSKTVIISSVFQMLNNNMHKTITFPAVFMDVKCRPVLWERNISYKCPKTKCLGISWVIRKIKYEKYLKCYCIMRNV
jgi:hypothetical protein